MSSRKDVAKLAGVSPASVSYYVNGNGYVSADTGRKIQKAIDELHYTPNQIARSLKIKDSKQFLFFCNEIRNPFYAELVYRATKSAQKDGYLIMFTSVIDDDNFINKMCSYQISGVFASNGKLKLKQINDIAKRNIPVVMLRDIEWADLDKRVTQIKVDYSSIMQEIVNHLKNEQYKDIFFISSSKSKEENRIDEKTRNFLLANENKEENVIYNITSTKDAYQYVIDNFTKNSSPDAFVCTNDAVAIGVMRAVSDIGLKIPDVAVVGFDNSFNSQFAVPSLTSVDIDMYEVGNVAIDLLIKKLHNEVLDDFVIKPKLIVRESSVKTK